MRLLFCRLNAKNNFSGLLISVYVFFAVTFATNNVTIDNDVEQELLGFFLSSKINDQHGQPVEISFNTTSFVVDQTKIIELNNTNETVDNYVSTENLTTELISGINKNGLFDKEGHEISTSVAINEILNTSVLPFSIQTSQSSVYWTNFSSENVSDMDNVSHSLNESDTNEVYVSVAESHQLEQVQCRTSLVLNSTQNSTEKLVHLTLNYTQTRGDSFLSLLCEKILDILCEDLGMEKSSCGLYLNFFEPSMSNEPPLSTATFSVVNSSGISLLGSKVLISLKKHQKRLEKELGLNLFKHSENTTASRLYDMEILTALTAAIAAVCIAALFSLIVLIVWQSWRRQSSGEWILNKPSRDKFDVVYFENGGYLYDDKHLSKSVLYSNEKFETKMPISSESTSRSVQTFTGSSDDIFLVPKEMMEMLEESFPSPNYE